jgi:hypothetical protein
MNFEGEFPNDSDKQQNFLSDSKKQCKFTLFFSPKYLFTDYAS